MSISYIQPTIPNELIMDMLKQAYNTTTMTVPSHTMITLLNELLISRGSEEIEENMEETTIQ